MPDEFHDQFFSRNLVLNDKLVVHYLVWVASHFLVLISLASKLLALANQKVDSSLHLLVAEEVDFAVALLRCQLKAIVAL